MSRRARAVLALGALLLAGLQTSCATRGLRSGADDPGRIHAVLLNGGGHREINYQSHVTHLKTLVGLLRDAGVPSDHVSIFSGDGEDPEPDLATRAVRQEPRFWLLPSGPIQDALAPGMVYVSSRVPGFTLRPARKDALTAWFESEGSRLRAGDTLLFYVTDHGLKNRISLWHEQLSVEELRGLLARLRPQVRVVMVMSQCYSGSFDIELPNVCGYFSTDDDRLASGCYPENRGKDGVGHSHQLFEALAQLGELPEAQRRIQVTDRTPDLPLTSTTGYFSRTLRAAAKARDAEPTPFVDGLLTEALRKPAEWERELRLLDAIGRSFGLASPRRAQDAVEAHDSLKALEGELDTYAERWKQALDAGRAETWRRFLEGSPKWRERFSGKPPELDEPTRAVWRTELLDALEPFTRAIPGRMDRLVSLRTRAAQAAGAAYRVEIRRTAILRMLFVLDAIAARTWVAREGTPEQRTALAALEKCQALSLGGPAQPVLPEALEPPAPYPTLAEERALLESVVPAWLGIQYRPLPRAERQRRSLTAGAVVVAAVFEGSAAAKAGLRVGDVVVGPGDGTFEEPHEILEWTMRREVGELATLTVLRDGQRVTVSFRPERYPLKLPELPGPPTVGSLGPPLQLELYRGVEKLPAGERLLFFWATWCEPCKRAVPEVLAFAQARGVPAIAITDEPVEVLDAFFRGYRNPFPPIVARDPLRLTFRSYGVSGTPTFVLLDGTGNVRFLDTGYNPKAGLRIDGWKWDGTGR